MKNPKAKGGRGERLIAVELSKWLSSGQREDLLWRSSMSGGRATVARKKQKDLRTQAGDLSAIHPDGQPFINAFYPEIKFYKNLNYSGITTETGHLVNFWKSTVTEAAAYNRSPMLITKENNRPIIIFMQVRGLRRIGLSTEQSIISSPKLGFYGYLLADLIKLATPIL